MFYGAPSSAGVAGGSRWFPGLVLGVAGFARRQAKELGVDPDLVRAVMHMETTHGYYDAPLDVIGANKSVRPMNVHSDFWKDLGYSRKDLHDPEKNIEAGTRILKALQDRMPGASAEEIATMYNNLGAKQVNDYGARVGEILRNRAWER
jgi:soluble lytic murein transglycosylase-like protein